MSLAEHYLDLITAYDSLRESEPADSPGSLFKLACLGISLYATKLSIKTNGYAKTSLLFAAPGLLAAGIVAAERYCNKPASTPRP